MSDAQSPVMFAGKIAALAAIGMLVVQLSGCVVLEIGLPAANPDKHPRPKTAPAENQGVTYFRHAARWHQMRVSLAAGEPKPSSGSGHLVKFSADASLWRYNRRTDEYDIPADFVRTDSYQGVYFEHDEHDATRIAVRPTVSSGGGGGASGWRSRPYTEVSSTFDGISAPAASEQKVSGTVTASFAPNGSSHPFRYQAQLARSWVITPRSAAEIQIVPATD